MIRIFIKEVQENMSQEMWEFATANQLVKGLAPALDYFDIVVDGNSIKVPVDLNIEKAEFILDQMLEYEVGQRDIITHDMKRYIDYLKPVEDRYNSIPLFDGLMRIIIKIFKTK